MSNFVLTPNAVAKLRRAIAPRSGNTGATAASGRPIDPDKFPPPFTVRWSASANDGAGAWLIWLPGLGNLVAFGDAYISTIRGVTAADNLPAGWYTIDDADGQSEEVYLVITVTDSTGAAEAELSETEGQATTGETVYNIKVAAMATDAETGARSVKQYVDSAVTFGGGGDTVTPDDVSTEFIPDPEEGEEPTGDEGKLQIFDFNSDKSDSPEGLAERLHADTKTGDIKIQSGTNIMLLARRDGKMVYIPLTAGGTDPEDEKPYDPENPDPCAHPGDNAPGAETHSDGGGGGVVVGGGGVPAGGDIHTGDDDCNCERI
jgi:hypothetical protein